MSSRAKRDGSTAATRGGAASSTSSVTTTTTHQSRQSGRGDEDRGRRSSSPVVISRVEEKNQLAGLNDRLANYIERVRHLEAENAKLSQSVHSQEEHVRRETTKIKGMYESELADARRLLDQLAKDKAKMQLELTKAKADLDDLNNKLQAREKTLAETQKRVLAAESQVNDMQARLSDALNQRRHFEDEYNRLKKEYDAIVKQLAVARKQLEDETVRRVDLENRIQSLKEELAFKSNVHEQELNESMRRQREVVVEVDGQLQRDYDNRLAESLRAMREENDAQIAISRQEIEEMYTRKMADLQDAAGRWQTQGAQAQAELRQSLKRIDELTSEVTRLQGQLSASNARIENLERQLEHERADHQATLSAKESEIRRLKAQLEEQLQEYRDLLDIKIQLDTEIAAYRKLLELEENRLNMSSDGSSPGGRSTTTSRVISATSSGTEASRKRRYEETTTTTSTTSYSGATPAKAGLLDVSGSESEFLSVATGRGATEVHEVDPDGQYVKLYNGSDKDISLGGWTLKQVDGDNEVVHKFAARGSNFKSHSYITIWSHDRDASQVGAADLTLKPKQTWLSGDTVRTILADAKGEEMALRQLRRTERVASPASERLESRGTSTMSRFSSLFSVFM